MFLVPSCHLALKWMLNSNSGSSLSLPELYDGDPVKVLKLLPCQVTVLLWTSCGFG